MRKFLKFLLGAGTVIAAVAGVMYFLKNILMKDYLDDFDDDDFDNDLYEEEGSENRDYVTINVPDQEDADSDSSDSEPEEGEEDGNSDSEEEN